VKLVAAALLVLPLAAAAEERGYTVIVLGGSAGDGTTPTLERLRARLEALDPERSAVVFTGNYMKGELPPKDDDGRAEAEKALLAHVEATRDFHARGGEVYFLPGQHDFVDSKGVRRLEKALDRAYRSEPQNDDDEDPDVMPEAACGATTRVELGDGAVQLLLLNSQWWMEQTSGDPNLNDTCLVKTPKAFINGISEELRSHRHQRVVLIAHHPLASYGEYGGAFTSDAHLDPLPVAGTASVLARQAGLVEQYQNHPLYQSYIQSVVAEASKYGSFIFVGGHDANLQSVTVGPHVQLVSGTSAREAAPVVRPSGWDFAAARPGWVELSMTARGEAIATFVSPEEEEPLYTLQLPPLNRLRREPLDPPPPLPQSPVFATLSKRSVWNLPGPLRFFAGSYYADAFRLRLPYDVLDLKARGFEPYKIGGGQQSNSVRVRDAQGGDWALRSTTKEPSRLFPYPLNKLTPMSRLLEHAYTATHPEAALATAKLCDAAGVFTVHPELFYLPDQEALAGYRGFVSDEVILLEQRPNEMNDGEVVPAHLGGRDEKTRFRNYDDMVEKLLDKPWKHRVDQEAMLRARLVDMLVGDWDRHRGQFRFAANEDENGVKVYAPVAMDRDQAFANYDGALLHVAKLVLPQARALHGFDEDYGPIRWLNYNARDNDAMTLNGLSHARWMEIAREVQASITDAVIDEAMATWHPQTYALDGAHIARSLKARRDRLLEAAESFYEHQARFVDVRGSNDDDRITMTYLDDGTLRVVVGRKSDDGEPWFDRAFDPRETDELRVYGLDGDDVLVVHGKPNRKIGVRFVGGEGKDVVKAGGPGTAEASAIVLYDRPKGARIDPSIRVTDERSDLARMNQYEQRENHELDAGSFVPGLLINPDQGAFIGGRYERVVHGFKKEPFAQRHMIQAYLATATWGAAVDYRGFFPQGFEVLDQQLDLTLRTPQYTRNFLGFTNIDRRHQALRDFWRVRQEQYEARWGLAYGFGGQRARVGAQLIGQLFVTERTPGRYVATAPEISPDTFGPRGFGGMRFFAEVNTFDSLTLPRRGVALHTSVEWRWDPISGGPGSSNHKLAAAVAVPFDRAERFVLLSRVYLEGIVGRHPFYFAPTLGDPQLRAYVQQQFAGDVAFAHSNDLRIDLVRVGQNVPSTLGINLSADHGRVFGRGVVGDDYHLSLGGGVWWSVADLFGVSIGYHRSLDGAERFSAAIGPLFATTGF